MRAAICFAVAFVVLAEFVCVVTSRNTLPLGAYEVMRLPPSNSVCGCTEEPTEQCGCCVPIVVPELEINHTACLNITYLPEDIGVQLTFQWDGDTIFNKTISARNPPKLCSHVPVGLIGFVGVCVRFYNLSWTNNHFGGCMQFELQLILEYIDFDLGCYYTSRHAHGKISKAAVKELSPQALKNVANNNALLTYEESSLKKFGKANDFFKSIKKSKQGHPDVEWIAKNIKEDTDKK